MKVVWKEKLIMFSCCRCVNPKSPKYKKKCDDNSSGEGNKALCHDDNLSSEEEIKVEIIETEEKPVEAAVEAETQPCDEIIRTPNESEFATNGVPVGEENQQQSHSSPKTSPNKSSTSSEHQQHSVEESTNAQCPIANEPTCLESAKDPEPEPQSIPTTVAEMEEQVGEITADESYSTELKNEENVAIIEQQKDSTVSPTECEPEREEKSASVGNGKASFKARLRARLLFTLLLLRCYLYTMLPHNSQMRKNDKCGLLQSVWFFPALPASFLC